MQFYSCSKAQLQKGEDALLQDVARMLVSCFQEHTVDRLQGGTYHLEVLTSRSLISKGLTDLILSQGDQLLAEACDLARHLAHQTVLLLSIVQP